ncbi:uncharacterized protein LOC142974432 [Anticarsia gemmatalis]|uniref:uncharacterized protein LOC142974432 n=1 Tax=Anticarsia gemmatalis TaxID=129554 RepID=UPI003F772B01
MLKCLLIVVCAMCVPSDVFCAPGLEHIREKQTSWRDEPLNQSNTAARRRRQTKDAIDIEFIKGLELTGLRSKETFVLSPLNEQYQDQQLKSEINSIIASIDMQKYKESCKNDNCVKYGYSTPDNLAEDRTVRNSNFYDFSNNKNQYYEYYDDRHPPPPPPPPPHHYGRPPPPPHHHEGPPPPDHHFTGYPPPPPGPPSSRHNREGPPPPGPHHHREPPPPPPHHGGPPPPHHGGPPPPHHGGPPPPHHGGPPPPHHHEPPPPHHDDRSEYYDRYEYNRPPPPPGPPESYHKSDEDRRTRQSSYYNDERPPPPPHRGGPPPHQRGGPEPPPPYEGPRHRGPPRDRGGPPPPENRHGGPPPWIKNVYNDRRPSYEDRNPPRFDNQGQNQSGDNRPSKLVDATQNTNPAFDDRFSSGASTAAQNDDNYMLDVRFADEPTVQTPSIVESTTTTRPSPLQFQAVAVTPED